MKNLFFILISGLFISINPLVAKSTNERGLFFGPPTTKISFDVTETTHTFQGFGTMVWQSADSFKVESQLKKVYAATRNVCFARINHETRSSEPLPTGGTFEDYEAYWDEYGDSATPNLGELTKFILLGGVPQEWKEPKGSGTELTTQFRDDYVLYLATGIQHFGKVNEKLPAYVEICNEPDGTWSAYISPENYDYIVKTLRQVLNDHEMTTVAIIGPGVSHLDWKDGDDWTNALSEESVASLGAWSVHAWIWAKDFFGRPIVNKEGGQVATRKYYPNWYAGAKRQNSDLPVIVTEFASSANTFHRIKYPDPSIDDPKSVANTVPYGARCYSNAISLISSGVSIPIYWQAADQSWGTGGTSLINLSGKLTNMYNAMMPLFSFIPKGARVIKTAFQDADDIFATAFIKTNNVVVTMANCSDETRIKEVTIEGLDESLHVHQATAKSYTQSSDVYTPVLEDVTVTVEQVNNKYRFSAELQKDSTLSVRISFRR